ncbi:MAG: aspartate aminotransferase family protein [Solirubrobacteraceae bacterium]
MSFTVTISARPTQLTSDELYAHALECLPGGNSRTTYFVPPHPPYAVRGEGCVLIDADGHEVLDFQGNYTALVHGHARREIVEAASDAIREGASFGLPTAHEVDLAQELSRRVPGAERWRFASSGTEAVMMGLRLARFHTGRPLILRFNGCYHGTYDGALEPGAPGVPTAIGGHVLSIPGGDLDAVRDALDDHGSRIACVLFDAMPNRAGLVPAGPEYVRWLRDETERRGILLLLDEVITFRIAYGGIQSLYGLRPDITILGKVIGGGFPIGAVGGRADVMCRFDPQAPGHLSYGGTFSANPVSMRAGLASLKLLTGAEIERINRHGDRLRHELGEQGWEVTGRGSLLRVHTRDPVALWWRLYEKGVMIAANGLMALSTAMSDSTVEQALAAFNRVRSDG